MFLLAPPFTAAPRPGKTGLRVVSTLVLGRRPCLPLAVSYLGPSPQTRNPPGANRRVFKNRLAKRQNFLLPF